VPGAGFAGSGQTTQNMRSCATTLIASSFLALASAAIAPEAVAKPRPIMIDSFGLWTLKKLGFNSISFPVSPHVQRKTISIGFRLPKTARQGPRTWYLIHLHFRIEFSTRSGSGRAYVDASTGAANDTRASAQIRFDVVRDGTKLTIASDSLGLVAGHVVKRSSSRQRTIVFDNYIPYAGIKPGLNVLGLELEQYGSVRVERLEFFPDTGIRYSPLSPARISLGVRVESQRVDVGKPFKLEAQVRNTGGNVARGGVIAIDFSRDELRAERGVMRLLPPIGGGRTIRRDFYLRALGPGAHEVDVEARVGLSRPVVPVKVVARAANRMSSPHSAVVSWWLWVVVGLGGAAGVAMGLWRLQRKS
jgi:hypothetical protein